MNITRNKIYNELDELERHIEANLDEDGNCILDEFPYLVILESPFLDPRYDGCLDWLENNIHKDNYRREWVTRVYFKNDADAMAFKLLWQ